MIYLSILLYFVLKIFPVDNSGICTLGHASYRESKKYTGEVKKEVKFGGKLKQAASWKIFDHKEREEEVKVFVCPVHNTNYNQCNVTGEECCNPRHDCEYNPDNQF